MKDQKTESLFALKNAGIIDEAGHVSATDWKQKLNQKGAGSVLQINIDMNQHEIACLIVEGCVGSARPEGTTALQAMDEIKASNPEAHDGFMAAARNVTLYVIAQLRAGSGLTGAGGGGGVGTTKVEGAV